MRQRVAIIGGGVSGLAAAYHLHQLAPHIEIKLLEASSHLGGVIQTSRQDGFLIENAAENFITTSRCAVELCERLGLADQLVRTQPVRRQASVVCNGRLEPIPSGFVVMAPSRIWPLLSTRILSVLGKLRVAWEYFVPRRKDLRDESLESFVCRRFGPEMFRRLVQPLVGGIYTADPSRLSVAATMPRFLQMEREYGSLIRGMLRQNRKKGESDSSGGAGYNQFMTLRGGMSTLIDALADALPAGSVQTEAPVCSIVARQRECCGKKHWAIRMAHGSPAWLDADGIIVAAPAKHAASILATTDSQLADELREIEYASCAVVSLAYRRDEIKQPLDSFGFVVPLAENRLILSGSFSSLKYPGRAPEETVLMRVFIGGACQSGLLRLPSEQLIELAEGELSELLKIEGKPLLRKVKRLNEAMPQYHVGHEERVASVQRLLTQHPALALAGSSVHGIGIPGCIQSGQAAASQIASTLDAASVAAEPVLS